MESIVKILDGLIFLFLGFIIGASLISATPKTETRVVRVATELGFFNEESAVSKEIKRSYAQGFILKNQVQILYRGSTTETILVFQR